MARAHRHDPIARQNLAQLAQGGRDLIVGAARLHDRVPLDPELDQTVVMSRAVILDLAGLLLRDAGVYVFEYEGDIAHDANLDRIVLADFARIDVHVDQFRVRDREADALALNRFLMSIPDGFIDSDLHRMEYPSSSYRYSLAPASRETSPA